MKRILAILLALAVGAACCAGTALAAGVTLTAQAPAETCAPGATVTLTFGLAADSHVAAADFKVTYDTAVFEYAGYENGDLINNRLAAGNCVNGTFLFSMAGETEITQAGTLFTLDFLVDSSAKGDYSFQFFATSCCDEDLNNLSAQSADLTVTVAGEAVSTVSVTPVPSQNEAGSTTVVSDQADENASGPATVDSQSGTTSAANGKGGFNASVLPVVIVVTVIVLAALLVARAVARAKRSDRREEAHTPILTDEQRKLLDLDEDALADEQPHDRS